MINILNSGNFNEKYIKLRNGEEFDKLLESIKDKRLNKGLKNKIINFIKADIFLRIFIKKNNHQKSGEAHKWMYDSLDLKLLLENSGLKNFRIVKYNESIIPNWSIFELDKSKNSNSQRKPDYLFVEDMK